MFPVIAVTASLLAVAVACDATGAARRWLARPEAWPSDGVLLGVTAVLLAGAALAWRRIAELRGEVARRRRADAMLHAGLDNVPSVVYAVDRAGRLILVNRSFERTFSLRAEDAVGRTAAQCLASAPGDTFAASDAAALALDDALEVEETVHVRGEVRTFASTKFVLRDGAARPYAVCSISNDVTARRKTEEALLQAQKVEGMGQLAGGVAHDLNNVLSVIIGQSELLGMRLDAGSPVARRLAEIRKAASLGANLTRQLLAFSRRETLKPQVLGLNGVVQDVAQMLGRLIGEQVRLSVRCDPDDLPICADPTHLQQLLLNLAVNARDAMPGGGALTIETGRVDLDAAHAGRYAGARTGPHARLRVRDTGCGIEAELMPRIFEPFFTTKVKGRGTGLGLSTVSDVVKRGGGHLTVQSEPGQGTTFDVYWPLARGGAAVAGAPAIDGRLELGGTETVLYVEDDPGLLHLGADLMREAGYCVLLAADAREALAIAACDPWRIDVLVTDVVLPGLHGPELWQQLADERPGLPVVYVTGYLGDPQVLRLGSAARLVEKPFTGEELLRGVRRCLDVGWNPPAEPGEAWPSGLRSSVRRAVTGMLAGGLLFAASAQAAPIADASRRWQLAGAWNQSHGLPQERVYAIAQTRDGYLWLGTRGGVARFDGVRFKTFDDRAAEAIGDNEAWALLEDGAGLWIGTYGGGLSRLEAGRVTSYTTREGLVNDFVRVLARDSEGSLWIGTDGGLSRLQDGRFTNFRVADGLTQPVVKALAADARGGVWVATPSTDGSGLHHLRSGRLERVAMPGVETAASSIEALRPTAEGAVWLGTLDGLVHWESGAATRYTVADGLSSNRIRALHEDARGLWIATERGIDLRARWSNTFRTILGEASANDPTTLRTDAEGNLWVGTRTRGLARFDEGLFTSYTDGDGLPSTDVTTVLEDTAGTLWVGTSRGLAARAAEGFKALGPESGPKDDPVFSLMEDGAGHLWVGTDSALFRTLEALPKAPRFVAIEGVPRTMIRSLHTDRAGTVWIGTNGEGLLRHDGQGLTTFGVRQGLSHGAVRAIAETGDGSLWIGTKGGGLNRMHEGRFTVYTTRDGLPSDSIQALHVDGTGVLWVATRRGLARLKDGRFSAIGRGQGLLANHVYGFAEDAVGNLWMTCGRGVFRVSREQLDAVADGRRASLFSVAYGREHGLMATVGAVSDDPVAWRARDGRLYFAMSGGLATVDPARLTVNELPPPVQLEEGTVDGRAVDVAGPAVAPPGRGDLMLRYTALSFVAPEKVTFRYQLQGFDRTWVEAGSRRVAFYTNVPPGRYRFQVVGCNSDGVCNEQGAALELTLQNRFYRTTWFLAACLLGVAAAALGAHRLRLRQLEERERELSARVEDAVAQLQTLKGLLPICSSCKSIRDDEGSWNQMEAYIQEHSAAEFTHGICPECAEKMFPGRGFRVVTGTH